MCLVQVPERRAVEEEGQPGQSVAVEVVDLYAAEFVVPDAAASPFVEEADEVAAVVV